MEMAVSQPTPIPNAVGGGGFSNPEVPTGSSNQSSALLAPPKVVPVSIPGLVPPAPGSPGSAASTTPTFLAGSTPLVSVGAPGTHTSNTGGSSSAKVTVARPMNRFPQPREMENSAVRTEQSKIFVCFLPAKFSEDDLRQLFEKFGKLRSVSYSEGTHSGSLQFVSCFAASKAAKEMDNINVGSNRIQVKLAMRRTDVLADAEVGFTGSTGSVSSNGGQAPPAYNALAPPLPPQPSAGAAFVNTAPAYPGAPLTHLPPPTPIHHHHNPAALGLHLSAGGQAGHPQLPQHLQTVGTSPPGSTAPATAAGSPDSVGGHRSNSVPMNSSSLSALTSPSSGNNNNNGVQLDPCRLIRIQDNGNMVNVVFVPTIQTDGFTTMYVTQGPNGSQQVLATVPGTNTAASSPQQQQQASPAVGGVSVGLLAQLAGMQSQPQPPQQSTVDATTLSLQQQLLAAQIAVAQQQATLNTATQQNQKKQPQQQPYVNSQQQRFQSTPHNTTANATQQQADHIQLLRQIAAVQAAQGGPPNPQLQAALAAAGLGIPQPQQQAFVSSGSGVGGLPNQQHNFGSPNIARQSSMNNSQHEFVNSTGSQSSASGIGAPGRLAYHPSQYIPAAGGANPSTLVLGQGGGQSQQYNFHHPGFIKNPAAGLSPNSARATGNPSPIGQGAAGLNDAGSAGSSDTFTNSGTSCGGTAAPAAAPTAISSGGGGGPITVQVGNLHVQPPSMHHHRQVPNVKHAPAAIAGGQVTKSSQQNYNSGAGTSGNATQTPSSQKGDVVMGMDDSEENSRIQDMLNALDDDGGFTSTCQ